MAAEPPKFARVGDIIESDVTHPFPHTIRERLMTPESAAYANDLLMTGGNGWRLVPASGVRVFQEAQEKPCPTTATTSLIPAPSAAIGATPAIAMSGAQDVGIPALSMTKVGSASATPKDAPARSGSSPTSSTGVTEVPRD